ncbi:hypothetical protein V5799_013603 [Amblyomma americanum]|uniref:G-protein coupled receptors family 2 profile 2 domain-containing protein n=1 Tax=Amblyomma americanum TaxID=6943 RepID=A0AAQ4E5E8_AMBAM
MKNASLWIAWLTWVQVAAGTTSAPPSTEECNVTLPWTAPREAYDDVSDSVFESLMQCPRNLHGCSESLVSCKPRTYVATCSCAPNCRAYRDCCWDVDFAEDEAQFPEISCVSIQIGSSRKKVVSMIVGCLPTWPDGDVRNGCESAESFNETFYRIPATSINHVTYRNGFCALCNNDVTNATFWNATLLSPEAPVRVSLPDSVSSEPELYLRPCVVDELNDTCSQGTPADVSRKCQTYYAPVTDVEDNQPTVYRNVYCAICNGANVSRFSCNGPWHVTNFTALRRHSGGHRRPSPARPPNLAAIFKPVVRTSTCYVQHDDHCYIKDPPSLYKVKLKLHPIHSDDNETQSSSPRSRAVGSPNTYHIYNYATVVCMALSICCLALKVVVFCAYKEARSFSSKCTLCLSVTLMITQLLYLLTSFVSLQEIPCVGGALLVHYGFLSTFFWTSVLSHDICKNITSVKLSSARDKTLALYCVISWGVPLVIVAAALMVHCLAPESVVSPSYGTTTCWIGSIWGLVLFFLAPMAALLLFCLLVYLKTVSYIRSIASGAADVQEGQGSARDAGQRRQQLARMALFCRLAVIMGAAWTIAFFNIFVSVAATDLVVNVLLGLQGVYLFFAFKDYRHFVSSMPGRKKTALSGSRGTSSSGVTSSR